ncbi:tetraacyldisaccharide 4'-kinase [Roseitalea porphyridii]|uniref:Tetraacyldisaccharide 4'-kinase n=1 Tax=Roseitalea porphyridii TaxID=1852022 RepID=A0A4P6UYV9_9HYPH|nr:tetraacyldisaccharide 4'-kinase [Roseitalea porphyridii]QBK29494.1 tetraacyldisaccharide 4'-kinase [Roseitalea porphyridii]
MAGSEAPPFWYRPPGLQARLLWPASLVYGGIARRRMDRADPPAVDAPVLCIGNLTVGGTGKTPTAIALARAAERHRYRPGIVSRGYGGGHIRPHRVDPETDTARSVGDEALLLARAAPTVIGANRARNAQMLIDAGCDFIIMDDGFQSRSLRTDHALITLDARRGIGNGRVIPAGPLRAPLRDQMRLADAVLRIGTGEAGDQVVRAAARAGKPVMQAHLQPANVRAISGRQVLAYCGIGDPGKFYETLHHYGCMLAATRSFGDHHMFTEADARALVGKAEAEGLELVTTEKDFVRLSHNEGPLATLRQRTHVLPVSLVFETRADAEHIIAATERRYHQRRIGG